MVARAEGARTLRSKAPQAYLEVRQRLRGGLEPGAHLVEEDVAATALASRSATREAMVRASAEGLLIARPHRGFHVPERSTETEAQLWACVAALEEVLFARLVATDTDLSALETSITEGDELDLHRALVAMLPDEPVTLLLGHLLARLEQDPAAATYRAPAPALGPSAHTEVIAALRAGRAEHASQTMHKHLLDVAEELDFEPLEPDDNHAHRE